MSIPKWVGFASIVFCGCQWGTEADEGNIHPEDFMPMEAGLSWRYGIQRQFSPDISQASENTGRDSGDYTITLLAVTPTRIGFRIQENLVRTYPDNVAWTDTLSADRFLVVGQDPGAMDSAIRGLLKKTDPNGLEFLPAGNWRQRPERNFDSSVAEYASVNGENRMVFPVQYQNSNDPLSISYGDGNGTGRFMVGVGLFSYRFTRQAGRYSSQETDSLLDFSKTGHALPAVTDRRGSFSSIAEGNSWRYSFRREVSSVVTMIAWNSLRDSGEYTVSLPNVRSDSVMVRVETRFHRKHIPSPGDVDVESDMTFPALNDPDSIESAVRAAGGRLRIDADGNADLKGLMNWRAAPPEGPDSSTVLEGIDGKRILCAFLSSRNPLGTYQSAPADGLARFEEGKGMISYSVRFQADKSYNEEADTLIEFKRK